MHDTMVRMADVWKTCNKIRAAAFRVGLNLWDWYRPLDPEGNSLISESKFVSVLGGPLRSVVGLSDAEIAQLADYFRAQDGRVLYHQLCQIIHGEDAGGREQTSSDCVLESRPAPAAAACRELGPAQTRRLCCLLATIADRQLPLKPYFQDYELVAKNDGRVTFAHLARILTFAGVLLSPDDFNLLVRRFIKDSYTIDYVEFLAALDAVNREGIQGLGPSYRNPKAVIDTTLPKLSRPEVAAGRSPGTPGSFHPALAPPRPVRGLLDLMLKVQQFVKQRSIRVVEFFRDFDPLNSGRISAQQFTRALDAMGLGGVLSPREALCVARHYCDHNDPPRVCWRTFEDDCDQVFTIKELEKHPEVRPDEAAAALAAAGASDAASDVAGDAAGDVAAAEQALLRLRAAVAERNLDLRPAFNDHDHHNNGHVSASCVWRALWRAGALLAAAHAHALVRRYADDCGFNYARLLHELEERPAESAAVAAPLPAPRRPAAAADPADTDIVQILAKIKGKMVREGIRPREFLRQFDPLRQQVVARADFYRALAAAGLALTPLQVDTLMQVFSAPGRRRLVEYERFCGVVEQALATRGAERAPLLAAVAHAPPAPAPPLDHAQRALAAAALTKLAAYPDHVSNILEVFKEMDACGGGRVSAAACTRALARRRLLPLLSARELDALYLCFAVPGCRDEVNYRALVNALDVVHATARAQPC